MKTCRYLWVVIACITCADCTVGYVLHYYGHEVNPIAGWMIAQHGMTHAILARIFSVLGGYTIFRIAQAAHDELAAGIITGAAFAASLLVYGAILLS